MCQRPRFPLYTQRLAQSSLSSARQVPRLFLLHRPGNSEAGMGAFPGHKVGQWPLTPASALPILCCAATSDAHSAPLHGQALASRIPHLQGALRLGALGRPNLLEPLSWTPHALPPHTHTPLPPKVLVPAWAIRPELSTAGVWQGSQNPVSSGHKHDFPDNIGGLGSDAVWGSYGRGSDLDPHCCDQEKPHQLCPWAPDPVVPMPL